MSKIRTGTMVLTAMVLAATIIVNCLPTPAVAGETRGGQNILVVGQIEHMATRNILPYLADDVWTRDVLDRVYDTVGKIHPDTDQIVPYILKGIDADDDGVFETSEYGVFEKTVGRDILNITAYYDFNGVYFHDGIQADVGDLLFSYHLTALNPRMNSYVRVLMDKAGGTGTNFTATRWLFVAPATKGWEDEPSAGDPNLRFAVSFRLQEPFALFSRYALAGLTQFPRHVWEGRGWRINEDTGLAVSPLHLDFGQAIYPESDPRFGQGVRTNETTYKPFQYLNSQTPTMDSAEEWLPSDEDVIGTGPFVFEKFNETLATAEVHKNALYFVGSDAKTGTILDAFLSTYIRQPFIDGILFYGDYFPGCHWYLEPWRYPNVDYCHSDIPPEFLQMAFHRSNLRIWTRPDPGFTYLGYNMRRPAIGKWNYGQANEFDIGLHFRKAVAHLIDKSTMVKNFLQGYGVAGIVPVSPNNVEFYNSSIVGYDFNRTVAQNEMDLAHQDALWLSTHGAPEAANWYTKDSGTGYYVLPGIGTNEFKLWCPNHYYDAVKSNSCSLFSYEMRRFGINVRVSQTSYREIINTIQQGNEDMYVLDWSIYDEDPDYLFSLFHSSNAAAGRNYVGFNDKLSDRILKIPDRN